MPVLLKVKILVKKLKKEKSRGEKEGMTHGELTVGFELVLPRN